MWKIFGEEKKNKKYVREMNIINMLSVIILKNLYSILYNLIKKVFNKRQ